MWHGREGRHGLRRHASVATALHALAGRGQGWLLAAAGVLLLVEREFVPAVGQLDTPVLALAVGLVVLGVVLPTLVKADLGATGLSFKRLVEERDAETERTFSPGFVDSLTRFAVRLAGEREAVTLVEEALARTYADWHFVPAHRRRLHVLCTMVHLSLGTAHLDGGGGRTAWVTHLDGVGDVEPQPLPSRGALAPPHSRGQQPPPGSALTRPARRPRRRFG